MKVPWWCPRYDNCEWQTHETPVKFFNPWNCHEICTHETAGRYIHSTKLTWKKPWYLLIHVKYPGALCSEIAVIFPWYRYDTWNFYHTWDHSSVIIIMHTLPRLKTQCTYTAVYLKVGSQYDAIPCIALCCLCIDAHNDRIDSDSILQFSCVVFLRG